MIKPVSVAIACVATFFAVQTQAQVNKCVDASGKTFYTQTPCPSSTKSSTVRAASPAPPAPAAASGAAKSAAPKTAAEQELDYRKRRTEQADNAKKEQEKADQGKQREENCKQARGNLVSIDSGGRQSRINEKGERYFLEDAQVAQERSRASASVEQWCK